MHIIVSAGAGGIAGRHGPSEGQSTAAGILNTNKSSSVRLKFLCYPGVQTNPYQQGDALQQIIALCLIPVNSKIGIAEEYDERKRSDAD